MTGENAEAELKSILTELARLREENRRLREENARIRGQGKNEINEGEIPPDFGGRAARPSPASGPTPIEKAAPAPRPTSPAVESITRDKLMLFRRLFRGREDVYARRWQGRTKAGYSPVCAHEWQAGLCRKPLGKCGDCPHRAFKPLDDAAICRHFTRDDFVIGIYPLLPDENCYFHGVHA